MHHISYYIKGMPRFGIHVRYKPRKWFTLFSGKEELEFLLEDRRRSADVFVCKSFKELAHNVAIILTNDYMNILMRAYPKPQDRVADITVYKDFYVRHYGATLIAMDLPESMLGSLELEAIEIAKKYGGASGGN